MSTEPVKPFTINTTPKKLGFINWDEYEAARLKLDIIMDEFKAKHKEAAEAIQSLVDFEFKMDPINQDSL